MNRYFSSFFITTLLYLLVSFFLFYIFADTLIIKEEPQEIKISLREVMTQKEQIIEIAEQKVLPKSEPTKESSNPIKKKIEKPKEEKVKEQIKVEQTNQIKEPIIDKVEKIPELNKKAEKDSEEIITKQTNFEQLKSIENEYLGKIRNLIEQNKTYPKIAKKLNQTGKVYITFTIMKNGEIKNSKISNSSQFESLDQASIDILTKIGIFESIPKELDKDFWEITIPIIYQIR